MRADETSVLSEQHLCQFGAIIQCFARYELTIQQAMASVCGTDLQAIMTLTAALDFEEKRKALLDLLRHREIPLNQFDRVFACLRIPQTYTPLRNAINHCIWKPGAGENSVQPDWLFAARRTVEPACVDAGESVARFTTLSDERLQYTLEELREIADELADNHRFFHASLEQIGLLPNTSSANRTEAAQ